MKTYASIKAEIAKLEKQAESAKRAEVAGVVARIKEAIAAYALTAHDLGLGNASRKPGARGKGAKIEVATRLDALWNWLQQDAATRLGT